jgi:hypothetical protein
MKGERLKFPIIVSQLEEVKLNLGDWEPQLEQRKGVGAWTYGDVKKIVKFHLKEGYFLLEQAKRNGLKLKKAEVKQLKAFEDFFEEKRNAVKSSTRRSEV